MVGKYIQAGLDTQRGGFREGAHRFIEYYVGDEIHEINHDYDKGGSEKGYRKNDCNNYVVTQAASFFQIIPLISG